MKKLRISHLAEADLADIWLIIAKDRPTAADRMLDRFQGQFVLLSNNPELGELREDIGTGVRQFSVSSYIVLYRLRQEEVEIVRVIHGSRDIPAEYRRRLFGSQEL
jgi:toxin ParE1/3/4